MTSVTRNQHRKPHLTERNHRMKRNFERIGQSVLKLTEDHKEGARSFIEKRKPEFKGR